MFGHFQFLLSIVGIEWVKSKKTVADNVFYASQSIHYQFVTLGTPRRAWLLSPVTKKTLWLNSFIQL